MAQAQTTKKTTKPKRVVKAPAAKVVTKRADAPKVSNPHLAVLGDGSLEGHTTGLISNNPRPKFALIDPRDNIDDRNRKALYKLRKGYGTKRFSAAFLDAGIMKVLMAAGLVKVFGGEEVTLDNGTKAVTIGDGMEFALTAAGQKYGTA